VLDLNGRTYLVTGAGGDGVGAGVCRAIRAAGGRLVVNDIDGAASTDAAQRYGAVLSAPGDVVSPESVNGMFTAIEASGIGLDGVVNNAGIGLRRDAHEATPEEFDRLFAVDVRGVWLVSRAFAQHAINRKVGGAIVNVASVHALATIRGYAAYAAMKSAVVGLTRGMAVELGEARIRCNVIAPGLVDSQQSRSSIASWTPDPAGWIEDHQTNHQALDRPVEPDDCGWAAAFFLSDLTRSVTGQVLFVDAGLTAMLYEKDFT
jgi:NAD(P)-dependent dehydrogenase (short-subunit alcohol dehydrogenase family)